MLGKILKGLRKNQEMTQEQLAFFLNISKQSVWGYENNSVEPSLDVLIKIADRFNVSLDYLVGRTNNKYNPNLSNSTTTEALDRIYEILDSYEMLKK